MQQQIGWLYPGDPLWPSPPTLSGVVASCVPSICLGPPSPQLPGNALQCEASLSLSATFPVLCPSTSASWSEALHPAQPTLLPAQIFTKPHPQCLDIQHCFHAAFRSDPRPVLSISPGAVFSSPNTGCPWLLPSAFSHLPATPWGCSTAVPLAPKNLPGMW